jgi:hypothetical protein
VPSSKVKQSKKAWFFFFQILFKLELFRQILEKSSIIEFLENPSGGSRVVPCGQTDGQTYRYD